MYTVADTVAEILIRDLIILFDLLKNAVCIPCPINNWGFISPVHPSSYSLTPWPFSDPHSTPWLFIDPLDGPNDPWGSISITLRTTALT